MKMNTGSALLFASGSACALALIWALSQVGEVRGVAREGQESIFNVLGVTSALAREQQCGGQVAGGGNGMKVIAMYKRKPGLSVEQFRQHYETSHVPMSMRLFPFMTDYRRNYIRRDSESPAANAFDFDVITELTFESPSHHQRMLQQMTDPAIRKEVEQDEIQFMDRSAAVYFIVDEVCTLIPRPAQCGHE